MKDQCDRRNVCVAELLEIGDGGGGNECLAKWLQSLRLVLDDVKEVIYVFY